MALKVERVDTWAAAIEDKPGKLAAKLNALTGAGADLEFVIARRAEKAGTGVLFVTPIQGAQLIRVAREVGFKRSESLHTVRIEGPNTRGHGLNIVESLAQEGLNLRGFTAASVGNRFVAHIAVDTPGEAAKAVRVLRKLS